MGIKPSKTFPALAILMVSSMFIQGTLETHGQTLRADIGLSDPAILADPATRKYYMTGTGGGLWTSNDLELWSGPASVIRTTDRSWMGSTPEIWAPEIHRVDGKYYYLGTFTNHQSTSDAAGHPRRAVHVLQSNLPNGTYTLMTGGDDVYLPAAKTTLDGSLFEDSDGTRYLLYCHEWIQNGNGTVEAVRLKADMSGTEGDPIVLFRARDAQWNTDPVTDGPFAFRTQTGRLGVIWTSWRGDRYVQGVAYSTSGTMVGPWTHNPLPITPDNYGHGMLFRTFDGRLLLSIHSHRNIDLGKQWFERHPTLFLMDDSGNELRTVMEYRHKVSLENPTRVMVNNPEFEYGKQGWVSTTNAQNQLIAHNQGGAITGNFLESWDANSFTGEIYQELNVPNGTYQVRAAAFRSNVINGGKANAPVVKLFANGETTEVMANSPFYYTVTVVVTDGHLRFGLRSEKRNYQWMGIDNVSILYYGNGNYSPSDIETAKDQRIYLRNLRDGRFLHAGNSWGTQAVLGDHPLDLIPIELPDGRFALDSKLSNGGGNHYAGTNGYLDSPLASFKINHIDDNTVTLTTDGTHYWGNNGGVAVSTQLTNANQSGTQWEVIKYEDLVGQLQYATPDQPVDATFFIAAPNFGRNDLRITQWQGDFSTGGDVANYCAEAPQKAFNVNQTLTEIPNGIYELRVQGFYRYGTADNAKARHADGTERIDALLFANNATIPLKSICDISGSIPNTLEEASARFSAGSYRQSLHVNVTNGQLRLGVKKTMGNVPTENWTVLDNFELYYLGPSDESNAITPSHIPLVSTPQYYDLSGIPCRDRHGIVIERKNGGSRKIVNKH